MDIEYYPAFSSRSVLRLDSKSGTTVFKVDTSEKGYQELPPQWLAFSMNDIDTASSIKRFWDESFIKSLKDTSNSGVRDGMHVRVVYGKGNSKDSVSLGNSRPKWIDSLLLEQITYLNSIAKDSIMKDNLKEIRDYLHL